MPMRRIGSTYVMDGAAVLGDVTLGEDVNVWCQVTVRGDVAPITIGPRCNLQDGVIVHCDQGVPLRIGSDVTMAHAVVVHCESVGDGTLIGIGARVMDHAVIGAGCLIAGGAVVPPRMHVPDGMVAMGVPAKIVRPVNDAEREYLRHVPPHYVQLARLHHERPDDPRVRPYAG